MENGSNGGRFCGKNLTRAGSHPARAKRSFSSVCKIIPDQDLQKLVAVNLADQGAGLVMVGDIGGVLGEDVAHDLVDRVIALSSSAWYTVSMIRWISAS